MIYKYICVYINENKNFTLKHWLNFFPQCKKCQQVIV